MNELKGKYTKYRLNDKCRVQNIFRIEFKKYYKTVLISLLGRILLPIMRNQ